MIFSVLVSCDCCKDYHRLDGLKQGTCILLQFWRSEVHDEFYGAEIKVSLGQGRSLGASKEESVSLPFPRSWTFLVS